jgi:hypothetical protein
VRLATRPRHLMRVTPHTRMLRDDTHKAGGPVHKEPIG